MQHVKFAFVIACGILTLHIAAGFAAGMLSDAPHWLVVGAFHSYFTVAALLKELGLPTFRPFQEGMFMVRLSVLGQLAVTLFWLSVHFTMAYASLRLYARLSAVRHSNSIHA